MNVDEMRAVARKCTKAFRVFEKAEEMVDTIISKESTLAGLKSKETGVKNRIVKAEKDLADIEGKIIEKNEILNTHDADIKAKEQKINELNAYIAGDFKKHEAEEKARSESIICDIRANTEKESIRLNEKIEEKQKILDKISEKISAGEAKLAEMRAITI